MTIKLETLDANDTLLNHQTAIGQFEQNGFELISFAKVIVSSAPANVATFRFRKPGDAPGPLTLVQEPGTSALSVQEATLNKGEVAGKLLISYAVAYVQGKETHVGAYRG